MPGSLRTVCVSCLVTTAATAAAQEATDATEVRRGDLRVLFRDNAQSPKVLSGLASLFHTKHAPGFDAYDPDTPGASAGLNFEHIISGHRSVHNKFTPRSGPYTLKRIGDASILLTRKAEDSPWKVGSTLQYTVREPHYVDFEFKCTPEDAELFGKRGYALFFFANYMNDVLDTAIHFRGHASADAEEAWIRADAPQGHPDWAVGGNYRARRASDLPYDDDVEFRLNTWSYEWPRIASPFYYGRADKGMTLILMFDRLSSPVDQVRFSLYKFKVPRHPRPAWDFQYVINKVRSGAQYGFRGRLVWKKFVSAEDCRNEYTTWAADLEKQRISEQAKNVRALRERGATVFVPRTHVTEVNANGTVITDADLGLMTQFTLMTDLSLEQTAIGDQGLQNLRGLNQLQWLNLYRTQVSDAGMAELCRLPELQHLPIGGTRVADPGLVHLQKMSQLKYLGLRGNRITDQGLRHIPQLRNLEGLHLGETGVTDAGMSQLAGLRKLRRLWLDDTAVSDKAIPSLGRLTGLRELHVRRTHLTAAGVKTLRSMLPQCRVTYER